MLTVTDLFCGAGGSSSGLEQIPGVVVLKAANHWKLAVETHNLNFPHVDHDIADISQVEPRRYPRTDILWASPECTNHSQARGVRKDDAQPDLFGEALPNEAAERSRATMFDVLRFAEHHRYRAIIVENVVEVRDWVMWPAWVTGLDNLGYHHQVVYLNSMFAQAGGMPAPQSRDRLYVVAWRNGEHAPDLSKWTRPPAWCPQCTQVIKPIQAWKRSDRQRGRYGQQYVWRCPNVSCRGAAVIPGVLPAAAAIDWALPGERIGDRTRPLSPKTVARIRAGLERYARPIHLEAAGHTFERRPGVRSWPVDEPFKTMHTTESKAVACPPLLVPPGGTWNDDVRTVADPMRTRTTRDMEALVVPMEGRDGLSARPADQPARTQTGRQQDALVVPLRANGVARPAGSAPTPTVAAAGNHHALVMRNNTGGAEMCTPVDEPLRTLTTAGHQSLVRWDDLLVPYYGTAVARPVSEPAGTVTTVDRYGLLGSHLDVDDCSFRMLEPHEIQAAMAFRLEYEVLGNKRAKVRQLGNAVTPPAARDLGAAVVEALTGVSMPTDRTMVLALASGLPGWETPVPGSTSRVRTAAAFPDPRPAAESGHIAPDSGPQTEAARSRPRR
jgi:DNA (cytosine-5)-methyltransferase 1